MTPRDLVLEQIRHRETRLVPYTLSFEGDVAERLDAHYGGPQWRERNKTFIDATQIVIGDKKEPTGEKDRQRDPYGSIWRTDQRAFHLERPALPEPTLAGYRWPAPETFHANADWIAGARQMCKDKQGQTFLAVWLGWGLFETSWGIRGFENVMMDVAVEPDFYEALLDRIMEQYLVFIDFICTTLPEIDAIFLGDDWGDQRGVMIGPERWRALFKKRYARIYEAIHARGKIVISHSCGSVADIMPDIIDIGLDVLESVQPEAQGMNPYELKKRWGDKIAFWGGLGSQSIIPFGTPQQLRGEIKRLCSEMGRGGGYILAPSKALQPGTPTGNAAAILEAFTDQEVAK